MTNHKLQSSNLFDKINHKIIQKGNILVKQKTLVILFLLLLFAISARARTITDELPRFSGFAGINC